MPLHSSLQKVLLLHGLVYAQVEDGVKVAEVLVELHMCLLFMNQDDKDSQCISSRGQAFGNRK